MSSADCTDTRTAYWDVIISEYDARTFTYFVCLWSGMSCNMEGEDKEGKKQIGV